MKNHSLQKWSELLQKGEVSSCEIVESYLSRVSEVDGDVKAFLHLDPDKMLKLAGESDARRTAGKALSEYDGIPFGVKDCIAVKDETISCGSKMLAKVKSPYDATVIARLKNKGLIPFGRLNMDEFAMGSSCENAMQNTRNPLDLSRVAGGSSGGSAAAVAAQMVPAALGSDTGGSIRQPAAFCGIVGMKPTYGRVSRYGLSAFASSLDQVGPMTNDVADAAIFYDMISGKDSMDSTSLDLPPDSCSAKVLAQAPTLKGVRIGIPKEYFAFPGMSQSVAKVMASTIEKIRELGGEIVDVSLPHTDYVVAVYYIIATAEASANLARIDGIRYGERRGAKDMVETYFESRGEGFGAEVKRRILLGTYVLSSGYYDAFYLRAQKVRTLIRRDFESLKGKCDVLLAPTTPDVAFKSGAIKDPLQMYLSDIFTIAVNLSGICSVSLPGGVDPDSKMPIGVQFIAPALQETTLLTAARAFELSK